MSSERRTQKSFICARHLGAPRRAAAAGSAAAGAEGGPGPIEDVQVIRHFVRLLSARSRLYRRRSLQVFPFFRYFRDLQDVHFIAPLQSQQFSKCSSICLKTFVKHSDDF